ncbi:Uncharacterised protein [Mycobacteroides abscessus subsp. abscessus]|nr:Uncharacterised protein [Mycobacteroides abscessus subsp. abscessus]
MGPGASRSTCTLVPPNPNALTPATCGRVSISGKVVADWAIRQPRASRLRPSRRSRMFGCGGMTPVRSTRAVLISPIIPAADMACPTLAFALPRYRGRSPRCGRHELNDSTSTASPTGVAVPCAST